MQIRILVADDAADFQALRLGGLVDCPYAFTSSYDEECDLPIEEVAERLAPTEKSIVLGAYDESELAGLIGLVRERHQKLAHKAFLWGMYVAPHHRRRGIGRELVTEAIKHARRMDGLRQIYLGVNANNEAAMELYSSMNFEKLWTEPRFMILDGEFQDEVQMILVLDGT